MGDHQHMEKGDRDFVAEARIEVGAAMRNLAKMELLAAQSRLERANALLRAALGEKD